LTTIDGIDLPHLAAFCRFRDRVTFCSQVFLLGKSAAKRGRTRLFRRLIDLDQNSFRVPRQDLPGMMKSLKSSYKT
jgi:hypothetical protein